MRPRCLSCRKDGGPIASEVHYVPPLETTWNLYPSFSYAPPPHPALTRNRGQQEHPLERAFGSHEVLCFYRLELRLTLESEAALTIGSHSPCRRRPATRDSQGLLHLFSSEPTGFYCMSLPPSCIY